MKSTESAPLLEIAELEKHFPAGGDWFAQMFDRRKIRAVDGVTFAVPRGTTMGLVGESGSGKSTIGKVIIRLIDPTGGHVYYRNKDLAHLRGKELKTVRRQIQMIFQDPSSSLNRRKTAGQIVSEPLLVQKLTARRELNARVVDSLEKAGLSRRFLNRYPHEMSGGQRQRVGIARALTVQPEFVICDEPVTALDVSIQAQILNLLMSLQEDLHLTYLFIAHDLSVVRHVSDSVAVMYLGKIVEIAKSTTLFSEPHHPYTRALLAAVPKPDPRVRDRMVLKGEVPSPIAPPPGCRFHPRCPERVGEICWTEEPRLVRLADGTLVQCHLYSEGG
jgi:oligopeptide/dipeptide ABC transporter ATP-binding protein